MFNLYFNIYNIYKQKKLIINHKLKKNYKLSVDFNPTTVLLSIGAEGFLSMIAAIDAATKTTTQAMTIPAIAPPDNPLEVFIYLLLLVV
jgi:hypothetical protein